jgi:SPP1 gp7 family putative phage head morphogenesis protein
VITDAWRTTLADAVAGAEPSTIENAIRSWTESLDADNRFAGLLFRTSFQSALAGQLFVRSVELAGEIGPGVVKLSAQRADGDAFLAMPFDEAVAFFRAKNVITAAEFDSLRDRFRAGGFVARQLATQRLQQVARDSIQSLLEQDLTIPEVVAQIRDAESDVNVSLGISPVSNGYLDNVIRTNVATAYGAGRWQAINDPNVRALRPWVQYRTAGDERVREGHRSLNGLVFGNGSELAARYAPPLFYRCRCVMVTLSTRQFADRGLVEQTTRVDGIEREEFWAGAPAPLTEADASE